MPEGPEIFILAHHLDYLKEKKLYSVSGVKAPNAFTQSLPLRCTKIASKGKVIVIHLEHDWNITIHFGMTGTLSSKSNQWTRAIFEFSRPNAVYFNDQRKFGTVVISKHDMTTTLAPDMFSVSWNEFKLRKRPKKPIAVLLLDQRGLVSGIGNYLRAEILHHARISPFAKELTDDEWKRLFSSIKTIGRQALYDDFTMKVYQNPLAHQAILQGRKIWY
jgi:formamidopyrimidine-DNA glycosylase